MTENREKPRKQFPAGTNKGIWDKMAKKGKRRDFYCSLSMGTLYIFPYFLQFLHSFPSYTILKTCEVIKGERIVEKMYYSLL